MRDNPEPEYRGEINLDGETRTYRVNDVEYIVTSYFAESRPPEDGVTLADVIESIISNGFIDIMNL